jgi:hypothetical protein
MLKRWWVAFDPVTKYFSLTHFWVQLLGLLLHLWNEGALEAIGNSLGMFIMIDKYSLSAASKKLAKSWLKWIYISGFQNPSIFSGGANVLFNIWTT